MLRATMRWLFAIFISIQTVAHADSLIGMSQLLKKAQSLFALGKCDQIIALGSRISISERVDDVTALAKTESLIARCQFQKGEMKGAEAQLRNILFLQPSFELDPFETPSPLIELFEAIKTELTKKTRELEQVKENAMKQNDVLETEKYFRKMSPLSPFVPFGFPQFEYGAKTKGVVLAALEATFLMVNISSYWTKRSLTLSDESNIVADQNALSAYNWAQGIQFASLGILSALCLFGAIDGLLHRNETFEESSKSQSRRISRDQFIQKLNSVKKED